MNINEILNKLSSDELKQVNEFLKSAQGRDISKAIAEQDKNRLLSQFSRLDPNLIKSKLNGITKEDILKYIK